MARNKIDVEITGGMDPKFISTIARSAGVSSVVDATYSDVKNRLEARAKAAARGTRMRYQYGSRRRSGSWGRTWIIWAMSPLARAKKDWIRRTARGAKNTYLR